MSVAPDSDEHSPRIPHREGGARPVIDWVALVGFLFSWTFAIGSYVFFVLVVGLIGGMFGGGIDIVLSLLNLPWSGHGTQCGWTLGAVVAAIGLPLGWVRPNERRFSFPRPVKLRQGLAERVADRRRKRAESGMPASDWEDSCDVGSVVKGAGLCGLIGTVLGFALGMFLMMCWFSLAMSPFAPGGWFDALEFLSEPSRGGGGGTSVSSSHPVAFSLVLVPPLVLGAVGFIGGGIYGLVGYVRCLRTVSREERERHRRLKRDALRDKTWRWYALVIGIVVTGIAGGLTAWSIARLSEARASSGWPQVSGRIVRAEVVSTEDSEGDTSYHAAISYEYQVNGRPYVSDRISLGFNAGGTSGFAHGIISRYRQGSDVTVCYRPDQPERSVLEPGVTLGNCLSVGFSAMALTVGFFIMFAWTERFVADRAKK